MFLIFFVVLKPVLIQFYLIELYMCRIEKKEGCGNLFERQLIAVLKKRKYFVRCLFRHYIVFILCKTFSSRQSLPVLLYKCNIFQLWIWDGTE